VFQEAQVDRVTLAHLMVYQRLEVVAELQLHKPLPILEEVVDQEEVVETQLLLLKQELAQQVKEMMVVRVLRM
jgi:PII-like signaling protein